MAGLIMIVYQNVALWYLVMLWDGVNLKFYICLKEKGSEYGRDCQNHMSNV